MDRRGRQDGSAFEGLWAGAKEEQGNPDGRNHRHNGQYPARPDKLTFLNI